MPRLLNFMTVPEWAVMLLCATLFGFLLGMAFIPTSYASVESRPKNCSHCFPDGKCEPCE